MPVDLPLVWPQNNFLLEMVGLTGNEYTYYTNEYTHLYVGAAST